MELNLPLIIHSRSAEEDTFNILNDYYSKKPKILMHCFTGSKNFAKKLLNLGAYFSFSGIITFKNATNLRDIIESMEEDEDGVMNIHMGKKKNE